MIFKNKGIILTFKPLSLEIETSSKFPKNNVLKLTISSWTFLFYQLIQKILIFFSTYWALKESPFSIPSRKNVKISWTSCSSPILMFPKSNQFWFLKINNLCWRGDVLQLLWGQLLVYCQIVSQRIVFVMLNSKQEIP